MKQNPPMFQENKNRNVIVFRDRILPPSETFIYNQITNLNSFTPILVGSKKVPGLHTGNIKTLTLRSQSILPILNEFMFKQFGFAPWFINRIRSLNPEIIHAHFGPGGVLALPISKQLNVPLIVTFHGFDATIKDKSVKPTSYTHQLYLRRRDRLINEGSLFIAVSRFIKQKMIDQGFPGEKIIVHNIGINTNEFSPSLMKRREPLVLFVGRLVEKKGCNYLIDAMERIQVLHPETKLLVIGDGQERNQLESLSRRKLTNYQFMGTQPPEVVNHWMRRAKVFCVPSVEASTGDAEGFGIVFIEAQATGLPVVSFKSGGIPEAVIHTKTGYLADERDTHQLSEYILRLLEDETDWKSKSQDAVRFVRENFNIQHQTEILEELYTSVIHNSNEY